MSGQAICCRRCRRWSSCQRSGQTCFRYALTLRQLGCACVTHFSRMLFLWTCPRLALLVPKSRWQETEHPHRVVLHPRRLLLWSAETFRVFRGVPFKALSA